MVSAFSGEGTAEFMVAGTCSLVPKGVAGQRSREQSQRQDWSLVLEVQPLVASPSSKGFTNPSNRATTKCSEQVPVGLVLHWNCNREEPVSSASLHIP